MRFEIIVQLKPEVLDPEARAIIERLNSRYPEAIDGISIARRFELTIKVAKEAEGIELATEIAKNYLANPVSESFTVRVLS